MSVYIIILLIIFLGFSIRGFLGFGFSAIVFPLLLIVGSNKPEILTVYFESIVSILFGIKYFEKHNLLLVFKLLGYSVIGVLLGIISKNLLNLSQHFYHLTPLALTLFILVFIKLNKSKVKFFSNESLLGILAGVMVNWSGIAGPPIVIYTLANEKKYVNMKSILSMYFMFLYVFTFFTFSLNNDLEKWLFQNLELLFLGTILILIMKSKYRQVSNRLDDWLNNQSKVVYNISYCALLIICFIPILKYLLT